MYFSSLKLFEVLKFFQFLMLFENQFLDTSSNFGAPFFARRSIKDRLFFMSTKKLTLSNASIVIKMEMTI